MDGAFEVGAGSELADQLERRSHGVEGRDLEDARVIETDDALVLILLEQRFEHGPGLRTILREYVALADVVGALAAGERGTAEGHMADEIERVEVFAHFFG